MASGNCGFCRVWHSASCCHPGRAVLQALVNKLDECNDSITGAFQMAYTIRGHDYKGPSYSEELKRARAVLEKENEDDQATDRGPRGPVCAG